MAFAPTPSWAQHISPQFKTASLKTFSCEYHCAFSIGTVPADSGRRFGNPHDYRWEGVLIGGGGLGLLGGVGGFVWCNQENSHSCGLLALGTGAFMGTIGVVVGGIVGSAIPKHGS